jgi:succinate-semialdehyde dehydrogenase / glutarate-semialdehyde dehydrogenase
MTATAAPPTSRPYRTVNPTTGVLVKEWAFCTDDDIERALRRGHEAYVDWSSRSIEARAAAIHAVADLLEERRDLLARAITADMGKALVYSINEVNNAVGMLRYYADQGPDLLADEVVAVPGLRRAVIRREPVGIALAIEPWNAPVSQGIRAAAPNLMLGNTVLFKPAESCAASTSLLDDLFVAAGFPAGAFQTILATTEQVSTVIADPRVRAVTLTGSDRAGSAVGEQAGRHIKPVVLELGGSDAFVVLDSADVAKAARTAAACRIIIGGQACALPKRLIVTRAVAEEFTRAFAEAFGSQRIGDPLDPDVTLGPMSSEAAARLLQEQYDDAVAKGATVVLAGGRMDGPGFFFAPAVLSGITPDMRVYREEAFGPLALVFEVDDAEAAVRVANDSAFGLGGCVFAEDLDEAEQVARRLDTGGVGINTFLGSPVEIPFGGTKSSGVGRLLGRSGMDQFANIKTYGAE